MEKKNLKGWHKSNIDLDKYMPQPCEIDEDLYNYLAEVVPPQYCYKCFVQLGECEYEKEGVRYYMTASRVNDKYFYLGILPRFKQPKL